jgi:hypothetical protein
MICNVNLVLQKLESGLEPAEDWDAKRFLVEAKHMRVKFFSRHL